MKRHSVKFFFGSLCLHLATILAAGYTGPAEHGIAHNTGRAHTLASPLVIRFVSKDDGPILQMAEQIEKKSVPQIQAERVSGPPEMDDPGTPNLADADSNGYVPTGLLTRLPEPITHIDLNTTATGKDGFLGEINLTIFINAIGMVDDVVASPVDERTREFADHVIAQFRGAHFMPGEIDGKAVKSELHINVVSENLNAAGLKPQSGGNLTTSD